ncbi:Uncharacterized protein PBTT_01813 [Plasmodiophora brassicae]|uniref:Uncharacterized protein n=1 Tax=Plasmodiophora brassicae TaxID=37360 RepID=A0A0G4ITJ8_PLABS|nr:hypothetical protein PBRA_006555 [Plasmodiophora brassicae]SPQ94525.1 unnamed protein product [Plasmodiophora brassicae]
MTRKRGRWSTATTTTTVSMVHDMPQHAVPVGAVLYADQQQVAQAYDDEGVVLFGFRPMHARSCREYRVRKRLYLLVTAGSTSIQDDVFDGAIDPSLSICKLSVMRVESHLTLIDLDKRPGRTQTFISSFFSRPSA